MAPPARRNKAPGLLAILHILLGILGLFGGTELVPRRVPMLAAWLRLPPLRVTARQQMSVPSRARFVRTEASAMILLFAVFRSAQFMGFRLALP